LTAEQLEASRAERLRQNGFGALTLEDARTWIEETGLCLFLPKRQFSSSIAPSFVEAVAGERDATPDARHIAVAEELLVRLELDGVAVRLNLLGQPGEQPDFVVAAWVLPYVYALRGDRDWRRSPQLTGSRQVSQLAVQTYKQLETGDATIATLKHALGREVTEGAVLRAITELWQQLRIIPVVSAPGQAAQWQLLRTRFQKAIAEGASTSQVTAISVLASIYLQAVIAASMEEVEMFLAPLTARSKVREVLRGLVATRQVHTISMGHAPHFYVAGTLPEFAAPPALYTSSSISSSTYLSRSWDHDEETPEFEAPKPASTTSHKFVEQLRSAEPHAPRATPARKPAASGKSAAARPHFSRPATPSRDRKPAQSSSSSRSGARPARRTGSEGRSTTRSSGSHATNGARPANGSRWNPKAPAATNGKHNGPHAGNGSTHGARSNGSNGSHGPNGSNGSNGNAARPANGASSSRPKRSSAPAWSPRNGHSNSAKPAAKSGAAARNSSPARNGAARNSIVTRNGATRNGAARNGSGPHKDARAESRPVRGSRKPTMTAGTKAGNSKRFGFTARPKRDTKKRG
jgi:23S rRNA pseudouridine2605 synthase